MAILRLYKSLKDKLKIWYVTYIRNEMLRHLPIPISLLNLACSWSSKVVADTFHWLWEAYRMPNTQETVLFDCSIVNKTLLCVGCQIHKNQLFCVPTPPSPQYLLLLASPKEFSFLLYLVELDRVHGPWVHVAGQLWHVWSRVGGRACLLLSNWCSLICCRWAKGEGLKGLACRTPWREGGVLHTHTYSCKSRN